MRLIFIIQVFSYLLRRYSFLFYRGKIQIFGEKVKKKAGKSFRSVYGCLRVR